MTQEEYKLFTGETVNFTEADWAVLVEIASGRLASFLCMESLPSTLPNDLKLLLANFMSACFSKQGAEGSVTSKSVRNFRITFASNASTTAFGHIANQFGDIVEKYSKCDSGLKVEASAGRCGCEYL